MNIKKIRKDFPILNNENIIYFDNACQSLRPETVIGAIDEYYKKYSACEGRSVHQFGERVTRKCEESRRIIAKFVGARKKEEIVFTRNTTEGINLIAMSLKLKKGDGVLVSDKEHNSNLIPWQIKIKKEKLFLYVLKSFDDNTFDLNRFEKIVSGKNIKLVSIVHISNLDGVSNPIADIIKISHKYGALVLIDCAQSASHQKINVKKLDVDFAVFSGHKMLGPSGIGFLYGKYELLERIEPFMVGGDTVKFSTYDNFKLLPAPNKFEAGLQNYAGIIGMAEAVKYLQKIGFKNIIKQEAKINKIITDELLQISEIGIIGPKDYRKRGGVVSFVVENMDNHQVALMLDSLGNVMVRSGQFCVHSWFNDKKIKNAVRVSLSFYNTEEEAYIFVENLKKVIKLK